MERQNIASKRMLTNAPAVAPVSVEKLTQWPEKKIRSTGDPCHSTQYSQYVLLLIQVANISRVISQTVALTFWHHATNTFSYLLTYLSESCQ
jgi:hypothetical protein